MEEKEYISSHDLRLLNSCFYRTHAHLINSFLQSNATTELTFIECLMHILKVSDYQPYNSYIKTNLTEGEQMQEVINFFHSLSPELGVQVEEIFSRNQTSYDIKLVSDPNNKFFGLNFITESKKKEKLQFNVSFINDISSMLNLAHEISHAVSNRTITSYELLKNLRKDQEEYEEEYEAFHTINMQTSVDCVVEIESHITELLFLYYMIKNNIITKEQSKNFINERNNSFKNNLIEIITEYEAFELLGYPVTHTSFSKFAVWSEKNNPYLLKKIKTKIQLEEKDPKNTNCAKYKFRYVVAEMVSTVWYKKFIASTNAEKRKMIKDFISFLQNNAITDIRTAISDLLDMSLEELGRKFYEIKVKESKQNLEF